MFNKNLINLTKLYGEFSLLNFINIDIIPLIHIHNIIILSGRSEKDSVYTNHHRSQRTY